MKCGFTLVELVVVVLILGILAAAAAPKFFNFSLQAEENGQRHSLKVIRGAIEFYNLENGELPGQDKNSDAFKAEILPYMRGEEFPTNLFDDNGNKAATVKFRDNGDPLVAHVGGDEGWLYDNVSGEFIANTDDVSSDGVTLYSEF